MNSVPPRVLGRRDDADVDFTTRLRDSGSMAKYDPLRSYLKRQKADALELSFREIENLIGYLLPKSAGRPEWWANSDGEPSVRAVQRQAWLEAGYHARLQAEDRVAFNRAEG